MKDRKCFFLTIIIVVLAITPISAIVLYIDPFFHYHKPNPAFSYQLTNQSYQNPGIARNFDYDGLICGSSMVELMKPSQFNEKMGLHMVKLPYSGGTTNNMRIITEQAFQSNTNLKCVIWGLDMYALSAEKDALKMELPDYLYDNNPLNDCSYLLNKEVLFSFIPDALRGSETDEINFDTAYNWGETNRNRYSKVTVLSEMKTPIGSENQEPVAAKIDENYIANIQENIIPLVKQHPETQFIFFVPPYPIVYWYSSYIAGTLQTVVANLDYTMTELLQYDNVQLFFYPNMTENTTNLYQYMDLMHYSPQVATKIADDITTYKNYQVTLDNKDTVLHDFQRTVECFDYSIYTDESGICQSIENFYEYVHSVNSDRYLISLVINPSDGELKKSEIELLQEQGLLPDKFRSDQYAVQIFDNGVPVYTDVGAEPIVVSKEYLDLQFDISNAYGEFHTSIKINGTEYCPVGKMLNIVVYDKELGRVIDSSGLREDTRELVKY